MTCDERLIGCMQAKALPHSRTGQFTHLLNTLCSAGQRRPSLQNGARLGKLYRHTLPSLWIGVQRTMGLSSGRYELNLRILTLVHRPYKQFTIGFNHKYTYLLQVSPKFCSQLETSKQLCGYISSHIGVGKSLFVL